MSSNENIIVLSNTPVDKMPSQVYLDFKNWVMKDGLTPSEAIQKFMQQYQCPNPDSSVIIYLIETTYPEIDISRQNFTYKIHDSGYPNILEELTHSDFDNLIEEMRVLTPGW